MIDQGLAEPWPEEVHAAAQPFLQGHLIESPPLAYAADLRYPVWGASRTLAEGTAEEERGLEVVDLEPDQRPVYGIITTQSCDLAEEDREPRQPWLGVFPVYNVPTDSELLGREYIYRLEPPSLGNGPWVADMRIELPLEKSVLVGRGPIEGFPNEAGYVEFANEIARRRGRPALSSVFHEVLNVTTADMKKTTSRRKKARRVRQKVHKLKLAIEDGTRLKPIAARLYVVTRAKPDQETEEWFGEWWDEARKVAEAHSLELLPVGWLHPDNFDVELYDSLVEIRSPL